VIDPLRLPDDLPPPGGRIAVIPPDSGAALALERL
jgi:hypothetical protein